MLFQATTWVRQCNCLLDRLTEPTGASQVEEIYQRSKEILFGNSIKSLAERVIVGESRAGAFGSDSVVTVCSYNHYPKTITPDVMERCHEAHGQDISNFDISTTRK